jgi:hypothetical protein
MTDNEFVVIFVDRRYGNAYYDRYRYNWIRSAVEHEEGRALHLDRKSGALVCYGYMSIPLSFIMGCVTWLYTVLESINY